MKIHPNHLRISFNNGIKMPESEIVCYLIVNSSLKMSKGKIGSQCGHAISALFQMIPKKTKWFHVWLKQGEPIICLKASDDEIKELAKEFGATNTTKYDDFWGVPLHDAGRTQVKENSLTVFALRPIYKSARPKWLAKMKLL